MQVTEKRSNKDRLSSSPQTSSCLDEIRDFAYTDGAYLAYTEGDAQENPKPEKGGEEKPPGGQTAARGGKKTGEETTPKKMPARAADTRPVLWSLSLSMD